MHTFKYHWFKGGIRIKFHKTENFICKNQIWKLKLDITNTVFNWKLHSLTLEDSTKKKNKVYKKIEILQKNTSLA